MGFDSLSPSAKQELITFWGVLQKVEELKDHL